MYLYVNSVSRVSHRSIVIYDSTSMYSSIRKKDTNTMPWHD